MVKAYYTPDSRRLADTFKGMQKSVADVQRPTGTEKERLLEKLAAQQLILSDAIAELQARSSHQASPADLTLVYGTGFGQKGPATRSFSLPAPQGAQRTALLIGSGNFEWAGSASSSALGIRLRSELWLGNKMISTDVAEVSNNPFVPAAFSGDTMNFTASVNIPAGAPVPLELKLYGYRSADGGTASDAGRVANLSFTLTYGDKY